MLIFWTICRYRSGVTLSGLLYLHRITDNPMKSSLIRCLHMFLNLCGNNALSIVRLVTTHWDLLQDYNEGIRKEGELREVYWKAFLCGGSQTHRFEYSCSSAWQIISSLPMEHKAIQVQEEIVDQGKALSETSAARSLLSWIHRAAEAVEILTRRLEELTQKVSIADSSENMKHGKDSEKKGYERNLEAARQVLQKLENDRSQFIKRHPTIASNPFAGPFSSAPTSTASTRRHVVHKLSGTSRRSIRRRPRYTPTLTASIEIESDFWESDSDVSYDPPDLGLALSSLSSTIQRLQKARATAAQTIIPGFQDAIEIAWRISETLSVKTCLSKIEIQTKAGSRKHLIRIAYSCH